MDDEDEVVFLHARGSRKVHIADRSKPRTRELRLRAFCSDDPKLLPFPSKRRGYHLCAQCVELATEHVARDSEVDWTSAGDMLVEGGGSW